MLLLLLTGCGHPSVRIRNDSDITIRNVTLTGRGFERHVPRLAAGETWDVTVDPQGESGVAVAFDANGRHIAVPEQGYFEDDSAYSVEISISRTLAVNVRTDITARK